jgi:hypothetical protein
MKMHARAPSPGARGHCIALSAVGLEALYLSYFVIEILTWLDQGVVITRNVAFLRGM